MTFVVGSPPGSPPRWTLVTSLAPSASATITTGTLTAYDHYLVVFSLIKTGGADNISIRFNGDTGAHYGTKGANDTGIATNTGTATSIPFVHGVDADTKWYGEMIISGKTGATANGKINLAINCGGTQGAGTSQYLGGNWLGGNATQISTMTFLCTSVGGFTGTINIYGANA